MFNITKFDIRYFTRNRSCRNNNFFFLNWKIEKKKEKEKKKKKKKEKKRKEKKEMDNFF